MRYVCLVHFDLAIMQSATPREQQDLDRRSLAYNDELEQQGHYVMSQAIQDGNSAVLVRVRDGKLSTTDGPYIETKEQMAGFVLIEARDMNEAIRLAAGIPLAEIGTIEVRPVYEIPTPP
ncbi:MAG: YciI family protein [Devosia nanyangense]|uniref:YciI family protein n=1 Tax=Devosia nanyangense TaxID=1228055 RepID=A0A933L698_9HYPH|nr:YciI family protein [Devosia nanyangense]